MPKTQQQQKESHQRRQAEQRERVAQMFRSHLQTPTGSTWAFLQRLNTKWDQGYLRELIFFYMSFLDKRLQYLDMTYLDLGDKRHEDYAFYADRLLETIKLCNGFLPAFVQASEDLVKKYQQLHPESILRFREKLLQIRDAMSRGEITAAGPHGPQVGKWNKNNKQVNKPLDWDMVTFQQVTPK